MEKPRRPDFVGSLPVALWIHKKEGKISLKINNVANLFKNDKERKVVEKAE